MNREDRQEQLDLKPSVSMPYERTLSANCHFLTDAERLGQSRTDKPSQGAGELVRDQGGAIEVIGVIEIDRVQNELLNSPFESWSTDRRWTDRVVVEENLTEQADTYLLSDHLRYILDAARSRQSASDWVGGESRDLVSDQVGTAGRDLVTPLLTTLTDDQPKIIALCTVSRKRAYLMRETGLTHRTFFRRKRLEPLIRANLIRLTHPDKPNHPDQAYVVTEAGLGLANAWLALPFPHIVRWTHEPSGCVHLSSRRAKPRHMP